jgi:hypothetical protein
MFPIRRTAFADGHGSCLQLAASLEGAVHARHRSRREIQTQTCAVASKKPKIIELHRPEAKSEDSADYRFGSMGCGASADGIR